MGFREENKPKIKDIKVDEFGIGSCIVVETGRAFVISTDESRNVLYLTNLQTFVSVALRTSVDDVYHISSTEAYNIANEVNGIINEANTRSDYGWNSIGLKTIKVKYEDN